MSENGDKSWKINTDSRLIVTESQEVGPQTGEIDILAPGESFNFNMEVTVDTNVELFEVLPWSVELFFRGKHIEIGEKSTRITPSYVPVHSSNQHLFDVLFVSNKHIVKQEDFELRIFERLGLRTNFWVCEQYNRFSIDQSTGNSHPVSWKNEYNGKVIVMLLSRPDELMQLLTPKKPVDLKHLSRDFLLSAPSRVSFEAKLRSYGANKRSQDTAALFSLANSECNPVQLDSLLGTRWQLGTASVKEIPIDCTHKFYNVPKHDLQEAYLSIDNFNAHEMNQFPLTSRFGATLHAMIFSLSIPAKLKLIHSGGGLAKTENWTFSGINREFSILELVVYAQNKDLQIQLFHAFIKRQTRIETLISQLSSNPAYLTPEMATIVMNLKKDTQVESVNIFSNMFHAVQYYKTKRTMLECLFSQSLGSSTVQSIVQKAKEEVEKSLSEFANYDLERPLLLNEQRKAEIPVPFAGQIWTVCDGIINLFSCLRAEE